MQGKRNTEASLWDHVVIRGEDECWDFTGNIEKTGYGRIRVFYKRWRAHRLAYYLTTGETPALLRHTCHNRSCCNPRHLLEGTNKDNSDDMVRAGRSCVGEKHPQAKLTHELAAMIKKAYTPGETTQREVGEAFGVCQRTVNKVVRGIGGFGCT